MDRVSRVWQVLCSWALGTLRARRRQSYGDGSGVRLREFYSNSWFHLPTFLPLYHLRWLVTAAVRFSLSEFQHLTVLQALAIHPVPLIFLGLLIRPPGTDDCCLWGSQIQGSSNDRSLQGEVHLENVSSLSSSQQIFCFFSIAVFSLPPHPKDRAKVASACPDRASPGIPPMPHPQPTQPPAARHRVPKQNDSRSAPMLCSHLLVLSPDRGPWTIPQVPASSPASKPKSDPRLEHLVPLLSFLDAALRPQAVSPAKAFSARPCDIGGHGN